MLSKGTHQEEAGVAPFVIFVGVASEAAVASCETDVGHALLVGQVDTCILTVPMIFYDRRNDLFLS